MIYIFLNENKIFCKENKIKKFISFTKGYSFCKEKSCLCKKEEISNKIKNYYSLLDKETKEKIKEKRNKTNLKRYGVINQGQRKEVQEKQKIFYLNKDNLLRIKEKIRKTNLEKYGVINPTQNEKIKEKIRKTNLEKYGSETPLKNEKIKEKIKKTCLERYGFNHPLQNEKIKEKQKKKQI